MRWGALISAAVCAAGGTGREAHAQQAVIFPMEAKGVSFGTAADVTQAMIEAARKGRAKVREAKEVQRRLGLDIVEQARACNFDVFCLVEVGEILEANQMVLGHVRRRSEDKLELKVSMIDVAKVTISEVLIWQFPKDAFPGALLHAARAASKRLLLKKDAEVNFVLKPEDARIFAYGDPIELPQKGPLRYWSGTYHLRLQAEGFYEKSVKVVIPAGKRAVDLKIELEPDPLFVPKTKSTGTDPFKGGSRRLGSGVSASEAGAVVKPKPGPKSALSNPITWVVAGAGVAIAVAGVALMADAQGDYNTLSKEMRFVPGGSFPSEVAQQKRSDSRLQFRAGSGVLIGGLVTVAGSFLWMIIEETVFGAKEPKK